MTFKFLFMIVVFEIVMGWFTRSMETNTTSHQCESGCCNGYFWDPNTKNCTKCIPGYTGPNCTIRCPYPTYGDDCQGFCYCKHDTCDISTGCSDLTKGNETSFPVAKFGENSTINTLDNSPPKSPGTANSILILLIQIFGGIDIILICTYSVVLVIDCHKQRRALQTDNTRGNLIGTNSKYENIDILISPDD